MSCIDEFMRKQTQRLEHLDKVLKTIGFLCQKRLQPLEGEEEEEEEGEEEEEEEEGEEEVKE